MKAIRVGLLLALVLLPLASTTAAPVRSIIVNTLEDEFTDDGDCSLREAIAASNFNTPQDACPGGDSSIADTITFSVSGTIMLGLWLPPIQNSGLLTIDGGGQITISGGHTVRVFEVEQGANLTLSNLSVRNGYVYNDVGAGLAIDRGTATIQSCTFHGNIVAGGALYAGGAIYAELDQNSDLTITNSTFEYNNASGRGGAIYISGGAPSIEGSNLSWNSALDGGAIFLEYTTMEIGATHFYANGTLTTTITGGAIHMEDNTTVQVIGSTFEMNGANYGGGISAFSYSQVNIANSVMVSNEALFDGGAISTGSLTDMTLSNTTFQGNQAGDEGGALSVTQANTGDSSITSCAFIDNSAKKGGAIYGNLLDGIITRSTFYDNTAGEQGGALYSTSSVGPAYSYLQIINNTFSSNDASWGGAIYNSDSKLDLTNNTLQNNNALYTGNSLYNDNTASGVLTATNTILADDNSGTNCIGTITDGGHNIDRGSTCGFDSANGSINNSDPLLAALADNEGSTQTHALLEGSPAVNAADPALCPSTDQRALNRRSGYCDIGAFEAQPAAVAAVSGSGQSTLISTHFAQPLVADVSDAFGNLLGGVGVTFSGPASGAGISNSSETLTTPASGRVSFTAAANATPGGPYTVTAKAGSLTATYSLTNLAPPSTEYLNYYLPLAVR